MNYNEIYDVIKILSENTIDISNENGEIKKEIKNKQKNNFCFPKTISIVLDNMIYIDKANLSAAVKNCFRKLATFANPEFFKKQRMRMSVYNVPMIIDCSKENEKYLMIPRGNFEYLLDLCKENNIKMNIVDKRNNGNELKLEFKGELIEEQSLAVNKMEEFDNGILEAPTGFGKTVLSCKMIADKNVNTLIITEKLQILKQWIGSITKFLNVEEVGQIGGGKNIVTNKIDVASIKTIWNHGNFIDIVKNYGMIIIDECHHLAAYTYENAVNQVNAKYVYGLSATPEKENGHTPIIKMQCGDIRYKVDAKKFNEKMNIPMKVIVRNSHLSFVNKNITDYGINEIKNLVTEDVLRSEKIIKDIEKEFKCGKNILVLTERLEHMEYFGEKLKKITGNLFLYHGGLGKKILKEYDERKSKIEENNQNKILIAIGSYIDEGFDDSLLDVLFLVMPVSGITRITQYTGRLYRKNEMKEEIIVYDYVDDNFKITRRMFEKRKKIYEKLGYEIV